MVTIPAARMGAVEREEARVDRAIARAPDGRGYEGAGWRYFWSMGRLPKTRPARVYFLWDGAVRAYHEVLFMEGGDGDYFTGASSPRIWMRPEIRRIKPVPMRPFRGFRYFDDKETEGI